MPQQFNRFSFVTGFIVAAILACAIYAATNTNSQVRRYDASTVMGGLAIQIVDHESNTMYLYGREKLDDSATYMLIATVDISQAGKKEIHAQTHGNK